MGKGLDLYHSLWPSPIQTYICAFPWDLILEFTLETIYLLSFMNPENLQFSWMSQGSTDTNPRHFAVFYCCVPWTKTGSTETIPSISPDTQSLEESPWERQSIIHPLQSIVPTPCWHFPYDKTQRAPELPLLILCCPLWHLNLSLLGIIHRIFLNSLRSGWSDGSAVKSSSSSCRGSGFCSQSPYWPVDNNL